jgi:L-fuculose-phosphate aldolase
MSDVEASVAEEIAYFSRRLVELDLVEWYGGNLSVRLGDDLVISRTLSSKGRDEGESVVRTGIFEDDEGTPWASSALAIHRAVYRRTDAQAVMHAHPRDATLLSFFLDEIVPVDENGLLYVGPSVKVVAAPELYGWNLVADELAAGLVDRKAVMLKWHGSFTKGASLAEAFHATRAVDHAAEFVLRLRRYAPYFETVEHLPVRAAGVLGGAGTRILPPDGGSH